jgi:hypothetical protein
VPANAGHANKNLNYFEIKIFFMFEEIKNEENKNLEEVNSEMPKEQEAQTEEINFEEDDAENAEFKKAKKARRKKWDFCFELVLFFVLGILIGIAAKNEAAKKITIGFDDYKMKTIREDYDISQLQAGLMKKQEAAQAAAQAAQNQDSQNQNNNQGQVPSDNNANTDNGNQDNQATNQ